MNYRSSVSRPIVIVGACGGTNIAESLYRGAIDNKIHAVLVNNSVSLSNSRIINALFWRLLDHRAPYRGRLHRLLSQTLEMHHPLAMITVGMAAVDRPTVEKWKEAGVKTLHYSTDDPWNPSLRSNWHLEALGAYDMVFTPRKRNMHDLRLSCRNVIYLPFGYDPHLVSINCITIANSLQCSGDNLFSKFQPQGLFVGGADESRAKFFREIIDAGCDVSLVGGYWDKWPDLKKRWLGHLSPKNVLELTSSASVNFILLRRANRDGHTMRSFEAGAIGACLLVEDSPEHRDIFGDNNETVQYFATASEAASLFKELILNEPKRRRLAFAVAARTRNRPNTYADRLRTMLDLIDA